LSHADRLSRQLFLEVEQRRRDNRAPAVDHPHAAITKFIFDRPTP
jgi:hypothetical protein